MNQWLYSHRWRDRPMLGALGQVIGVNPGDGFALGFNVSLSLLGPDPEDIAPWLERMNLATNIVSEQIAGIINPYIGLFGLAAGSWTTPSSFRDALLSAIGELGFDIDYSSPIDYRITPRVGGVPVQAPTPRPTPRPPAPPSIPRPAPEPSAESVFFDIVEPLPREFFEPPQTTTTQQQQQPPPPQEEGVSAWLWLGLGLFAVVLIAGDRR